MIRTAFAFAAVFALHLVQADQPAKDTVRKIDFKNRIQFHAKSGQPNLIVFENCKLAVCEELNPKGTDSKKLEEMPRRHLLPAGAVGQLVVDASTINRGAGTAADFGVVAEILDDERHGRVICTDPELFEKLKDKKTAAEYILPLDTSKCTVVSARTGMIIAPFHVEVAWFRQKLSQLGQ